MFVDDTTLLALHHVWSYRYSTTLERSERIDVPESVSGAVLTASGELLVYGHDDQGRPQLTLRDPGTLQLLGQCPLDGSARSPAAA